jgi:hypothetical protein
LCGVRLSHRAIPWPSGWLTIRSFIRLVRIRRRPRTVRRPIVWLDRTRLSCSPALSRSICGLLVIRHARPVCRIVLWLPRLWLPRLTGTIGHVALGALPICRIVLWLPWLGLARLRLAWLIRTVANVALRALPSLSRSAIHWLRRLGSFSHRYRRLLRRWSYSDRSGLLCRSRRLDLPHLADRQRLAAIALYCFLALFKRGRRRRRRGLGYNRTLLHGRRRLMLRWSFRS